MGRKSGTLDLFRSRVVSELNDKSVSEGPYPGTSNNIIWCSM